MILLKIVCISIFILTYLQSIMINKCMKSRILLDRKNLLLSLLFNLYQKNLFSFLESSTQVKLIYSLIFKTQ